MFKIKNRILSSIEVAAHTLGWVHMEAYITGESKANKIQVPHLGNIAKSGTHFFPFPCSCLSLSLGTPNT